MSTNKPSNSNTVGSSTLGFGSPVYEQVVKATQSGIELTEHETDFLGNRKEVYEDRGHQEPTQIVSDPESDTTHRIDAEHKTLPQSHLSLRLEKFMQLSARYAKPPTAPVAEEQAAVAEAEVKADIAPAAEADVEPDVDAAVDVDADTDNFDPESSEWSDNSRLRAVGYQLKKIRDRLDAAIGSQVLAPPPSEQTQVRVDKPEPLEQHHFQSPTSDAPIQKADTATPVSTGIVWEVDAFRWPGITQELIGDSSLAIDKLGNNALKLMTGVQNRLIVTGTNRGEGVSTIAASLAQWGASLGHRVLLVDADLENAGLTETLGLDGEISWTKAANQQCQTGQTLVLGKASGIYLMPLARVSDRGNFPSDLYGELGKIIDPISDCFNLVIFDVGPSRQLTQETNRIDLLGDATLLIQDMSRTLDEDFEKNKSHLLAYGISKMLIAENFTRDRVI